VRYEDLRIRRGRYSNKQPSVPTSSRTRALASEAVKRQALGSLGIGVARSVEDYSFARAHRSSTTPKIGCSAYEPYLPSRYTY
jgi:hypothetical protein